MESCAIRIRIYLLMTSVWCPWVHALTTYRAAHCQMQSLTKRRIIWKVLAFSQYSEPYYIHLALLLVYYCAHIYHSALSVVCGLCRDKLQPTPARHNNKTLPRWLSSRRFSTRLNLCADVLLHPANAPCSVLSKSREMNMCRHRSHVCATHTCI